MHICKDFKSFPIDFFFDLTLAKTIFYPKCRAAAAVKRALVERRRPRRPGFLLLSFSCTGFLYFAPALLCISIYCPRTTIQEFCVQAPTHPEICSPKKQTGLLA